jgi:hypothetical protein
MSKRTDCHRPGAIVPTDYALEDFYALPSEDDPHGFNCEEIRALTKSAREDGRGVYGSLGNCGVCGAAFLRGTIWHHAPTGDLVHMGADCAEKYDLASRDRDFNAALEALDRGRAARITAYRNAAAMARFCGAHEGLAAALEGDHNILADLKRKLRAFHSLSEGQVKLAFKIAAELEAKKNEPVEVHVPAPEGNVKVEGKVVSVKWHDSQYGGALKMTVKVTTPEGAWLTWGTVPRALDDLPGGLKGKTIAFEATLARGRDAHFALFKRPKKAHVVETVEATVEPAPAPKVEVVEGYDPEDPFAFFDALNAAAAP